MVRNVGAQGGSRADPRLPATRGSPGGPHLGQGGCCRGTAVPSEAQVPRLPPAGDGRRGAVSARPAPAPIGLVAGALLNGALLGALMAAIRQHRSSAFSPPRRRGRGCPFNLGSRQ